MIAALVAALVASPLTPLEHLLRHILNGLHSFGLPWAWSIVALTIIVRMLLVPLTVKQIHSMQNMQAHAPQMKEIQRKYKGDRQKLNEELMKFYKENNINPASSCLPLLAQLPIFIGLFYTLRAFAKHPPGGQAAIDRGDFSWLHFVPDITKHANSHWSGYVLLTVYVLSQIASTYFMSGTMQKSQRYLMMVLPVVFIPFILRFPTGLVLYWMTTNLWTVGQGLITRRLIPKVAPPTPQKRSSRTPAKASADDGAPPEAEVPAPKPAPRATAPREAQEEGSALMELQVEATGETVGEAKWAALRELEKKQPGLDKSAVRFQVVTEGERGLLGVGFAPAKVIATVSADAAPNEVEPVDESELAAEARELVTRIVDGVGVSARIDVEENAEVITVSCSGADLGMLIGRHGQTIDAVQYLANAVMWRRHPEDRKEVVVDAAGYRDRRRVTLESLAVRSAERALSDREPVDLEPMTAIERKVVHLRLKEFDGVETTSEGTEPNRYVVVHPVA